MKKYNLTEIYDSIMDDKSFFGLDDELVEIDKYTITISDMHGGTNFDCTIKSIEEGSKIVLTFNEYVVVIENSEKLLDSLSTYLRKFIDKNKKVVNNQSSDSGFSPMGGGFGGI